MKSLAKIVTIPFFFLWLGNVTIPIGGENVFIQFLYIGFSSFFLLITMIVRNTELRRSSITAAVLLIILLLPTLCYQFSGFSDDVPFEHSARFPITEIVKLLLVFLVFVTFNELLYYKYLTTDFLFKVFVISIIASIIRYVIEYEELIRNLNVQSRPESGWIGGWNTYAFLLSLACMILLGPLKMVNRIRYLLLFLIITTMLTTLSRGGILALSVGLFLYWRSKVRPGKRLEGVRMLAKIGAVVIIVLAAAITAGVGGTLYDRYVVSFIESQYEGVGYLQSVSSARTVLWLDTVEKFTTLENYYQWFFGYGVGHYAYTTARGAESDMGNQYLLFIYEYGSIIGVGLSVAMFRAYSALKWSCKIPWAQTMKAMLAIFLVSNFVESMIYATQAGWLISIGAAIIVDILRTERRSRYSPVRSGAGLEVRIA